MPAEPGDQGLQAWLNQRLRIRHSGSRRRQLLLPGEQSGKGSKAGNCTTPSVRQPREHLTECYLYEENCGWSQKQMKCNTKAMWFLFFQDRSALLNFLLCILCESSGVSSALEISLYWDGALQPCVSLWVRCCSLILNKNQLLLCGLVISAINWLPQYLINLLRETSSSYVTFALPSVTESGILIKRRKKSNLEKTQPHLKQDPATRMNPCFVTTFLSGTFIYHTLLLFL